MQVAWFCTFNQLAFGLAVMAVFIAVGGVILLQQLQQWPEDCRDLPDPPKDISTKYQDARAFGKLEVHVRALNFVWHTHNHGVLNRKTQWCIKKLFIAVWGLLLASVTVNLAAASVALQFRLGGYHKPFFWCAVVAFGFVTFVFTILPSSLALKFGGNAVSSPPAAVDTDGERDTYSTAANFNVRSQAWKDAVAAALKDPFLFSKKYLWNLVWYYAANLVEQSEHQKPKYSKASGMLSDCCPVLVAACCC
jgi:hypothetical protein